MHLKNISFSFISLLIMIFISCGSTAPSVVNEEGSAEPVNENLQIIGSHGDKRNAVFPEALWNISGEEGYIYFTGISPFYLDKEKSDEILLNDASQSAAVYDSVFGFSGKITGKSAVGTRIGKSFNYIFNKKSFYNYRDNLEEETTFKENNSIYRIYRIKKDMLLPLIEESEKGREPEWINRLPEIDGYMFSLGVSGRYSRISDSVRNADDAALEEMIKQQNITVFSDSGYNHFNPVGYEYASSELKGFYIIRRWWSPDMKQFYSLGIISDNK